MNSAIGSDRAKVVLVISNLEYGAAQRQVVELANSMDVARVDVHVCSLSDYVPLWRASSRTESDACTSF